MIDSLPLAHQFLLLYLLDLLHLFAANSAFTRMDSANLASVFTPGMLSRVDMQPSEYKHSQLVIKFLIDNQTLFSMPKTSVNRSPSPPSQSTVAQPPPKTLEPAAIDDTTPTSAQKSAQSKENNKPAYEESKRISNRRPDGNSHHYYDSRRHKHLRHINRDGEQRDPDFANTHHHPMSLYRRSTTWLPPTHQPLDGVDIDAAKAAAAIRSGHLLPNERRKVKGLARSKTVPSKRPKYGPDDPLQVVHVNRGSSVRERRAEEIPEL